MVTLFLQRSVQTWSERYYGTKWMRKNHVRRFH